MKTKYSGIWIEASGDGDSPLFAGGFWLWEDGNGADRYFDHYPTEEEIEKFRDAVRCF